MKIFVDTSVWSLAFRRDAVEQPPEVRALLDALASGGELHTTGLVLQELLQGFRGPRARDALLERFAALPFVVPERQDHVDAAELRNACRRRGVQAGTIDALLATMCIRRDFVMLTTDRDFFAIAGVCPLLVWRS